MRRFRSRQSLSFGAVVYLTGWALVAVGLVGCGPPVRPPGAAERDPYGMMDRVVYEDQVRWHHRLRMGSMPLQWAVTVRNVTEQPLDTGNLRTVVEVRNNTDQELRIEYKVKYFDAAGVELHESPWMYKILHKRFDAQLIANSISAQAKNGRVYIRWAREAAMDHVR